MEQELIDLARGWAQNLGQWGYLVMGFAALIEYIFPPFPGDSVMALGGAWAWRTSQSWLGIWVAVTLGNALGITLQHRLGRALSQTLSSTEQGWIARKAASWGLSEDRIGAMQERMRKHGVKLLLINRFLPSLRALVFLAAGASNLSFKKTLCWGVFGSLIWSAFILGLGAMAGGNAELMLNLLTRYQKAAAWVVGAAIVLWGLYRLYKWKNKGAV